MIFSIILTVLDTIISCIRQGFQAIPHASACASSCFGLFATVGEVGVCNFASLGTATIEQLQFAVIRAKVEPR